MSWSGQTALISGSTRGLGRTTAEWLAARGVRVVISGREQDDVDAVVATLNAESRNALGFAADLSAPDQAHSLAKRAIEAVGEISILVNNAGMSLRGVAPSGK